MESALNVQSVKKGFHRVAQSQNIQNSSTSTRNRFNVTSVELALHDAAPYAFTKKSNTVGYYLVHFRDSPFQKTHFLYNSNFYFFLV